MDSELLIFVFLRILSDTLSSIVYWQYHWGHHHLFIVKPLRVIRQDNNLNVYDDAKGKSIVRKVLIPIIIFATITGKSILNWNSLWIIRRVKDSTSRESFLTLILCSVRFYIFASKPPISIHIHTNVNMSLMVSGQANQQRKKSERKMFGIRKFYRNNSTIKFKRKFYLPLYRCV